MAFKEQHNIGAKSDVRFGVDGGLESAKEEYNNAR